MNRTPSLHDVESATRRFMPPPPAEAVDAGRKRPPIREIPLHFWDQLGTVSPPDLLVREVLGIGSLAVVYGDSAAGKTFFAINIGLHIAEGTPCFGRPVTQGAVLYVAAEGARGLNNRIAAVKLARDLSGALPFVVVPVAVDIGPDGPDTQAIITAAATVKRETGLAVVAVFLDTLARTIGSGDENTATDMGEYVTNADRIKVATGATVIIIHHRGKSPNGPRGSSALFAAADTVILVEKRDGVHVATIEKQKDGAEGQEMAFTLEPIEVGRHEGRPILSCVVAPTEGPAPSKRAPVTGQNRTVLEALQTALREGGEPAPASRYIPQDKTVATMSLWRSYAAKKLGEHENTASRDRIIRRCMQALKDRGIVASEGEFAWLV